MANLATSLMVGMHMGRIKRKNLIIGSNILLLLSTVGFGFLPVFTGEGATLLLPVRNVFPNNDG